MSLARIPPMLLTLPNGYTARPNASALNDRHTRPLPLADAAGRAPQHAVAVRP